MQISPIPNISVSHISIFMLLPADGNTLPSPRGTNTKIILLTRLSMSKTGASLALAETRAAVQEAAALLDGTAALEPDRARVATEAAGGLLALTANAATDAAVVWGGVAGARRGCCQVGDVLGHWVAGSDIGHAYVGGFARFAESVVA
jgi:glucose-6-phosphate isomerase